MPQYLVTIVSRGNDLRSRILIVVDDSEHSAQALGYAGNLLRDARDVHVMLFHGLKEMAVNGKTSWRSVPAQFRGGRLHLLHATSDPAAASRKSTHQHGVSRRRKHLPGTERAFHVSGYCVDRLDAVDMDRRDVGLVR